MFLLSALKWLLFWKESPFLTRYLKGGIVWFLKFQMPPLSSNFSQFFFDFKIWKSDNLWLQTNTTGKCYRLVCNQQTNWTDSMLENCSIFSFRPFQAAAQIQKKSYPKLQCLWFTRWNFSLQQVSINPPQFRTQLISSIMLIDLISSYFDCQSIEFRTLFDPKSLFEKDL